MKKTSGERWGIRNRCNGTSLRENAVLYSMTETQHEKKEIGP